MGNTNSRGKKSNQSAQQTYPNRPQSAPLYPAEPPPPYTPTPQPPYQAHSMAYGMNHHVSAPAYHRPYASQHVVQPVVHAHFDAGARFDGISRPSIPPPPPGVYPNAAQMAVVSGHKVILEKKKNSFLGDRGAGYTFW